jgi:N-acetylglucosamine kinase
LLRYHFIPSSLQLEGIPKVAEQLIDLFHRAKRSAGIPQSEPLESFGMCSSGFLQPGPQQDLRAELRTRDPALAKTYYIDNDSPGSVYTAAGAAGGAVIISGTGSMSELIFPLAQPPAAAVAAAGAAEAEGTADATAASEGTEASAAPSFTCGGWGHLFGDEGSAYYIASRAVRKIFRAADGYQPLANGGREGCKWEGVADVDNVAVAQSLMLEYFGVEDRTGMLQVFYKDFAKARVAGFTRHLARGEFT